MGDLKTTAEERAVLGMTPGPSPWVTVLALVHDVDTLLAENARLNGDLDAIAVAMGLANEHEGHVQRAGIERLCEDALAARRAEAMLAEVQAENAKLRAVTEAARDACNISLNDAGPEAFATIADLRKTLAALEAP